MTPPKKKTGPRKRVLTIQSTSDNSPPRSSWQAKYQELLPADSPTHGNNGSSDGVSSTTPANALEGLLGDYNSDSESGPGSPMDSKIKDFMKELERDNQPEAGTSQSGHVSKNGSHYQVPGTSWIQCFDQNSGYPYYWNQYTNEVSWQAPPEFVAALQVLQKQQTSNLAVASSSNSLSTMSSTKPAKPKVKAATKKKYPWEGDSDSEDEKIELITSFGPQSGDESEDAKTSRSSKKNRIKKATQDGLIVGPHLPHGKEEAPDVYETSSLMTPLVADVGPPGVEVAYVKPSSSAVPDSSAGDGILSVSNGNFASDSSNEGEDVLAQLKKKAKWLETMGGAGPSTDNSKLQLETCPQGTINGADDNSEDTDANDNAKNDYDMADEILAEIEKEIPPDLDICKPIKSLQEKAPASFALIASYGDDSDVEDSVNESPEDLKSKSLFPAVLKSEASANISKPLFPSAASDTIDDTVAIPNNRSPIETRCEAILASSTATPALLDPSLPDSRTTHKAFKRKKRIELDSGSFGTSSNRADVEAHQYLPPTNRSETELVTYEPDEVTPVTEANPKYNMDPSTGEHRGFGFLQREHSVTSAKKSTIQFVKAETLTFQSASRSSSPASRSVQVANQDLIDGAALLKEKLAFLGEGKEKVSAVQQMAIQLETLVSAWQSGALTPAYLCQWLGSRAVELSKNEQAAAPPGWTCEWEREAKRYCYRNTDTGVVVWEYPEPSEGAVPPASDLPQEEVEMELSDTPPRMSPNHREPDPESVMEPSPPPPPVISRSVTPPPPPPPSITHPPLHEAAIKRSLEEVSSSSEGIVSVLPPPPPSETYPPLPPEPDEPPPPGVDDLDIEYRSRLPVVPPDSSSQFHVKNLSTLVSSVSSSSTMEVSTSINQERKRSLISELDSFYMDLAKLDSNDSVTTSENETTAGYTAAPVSTAPLPVPPPLSSRAPLQPPSPPAPRPAQASSSQEPPSKKKKKNKPGLTLKKKGVSSLVAKWQQVREEARRTYSSDEDNDDVSSTHK